MKYELTNEINHYYNIQNIFLDHPLTSKEIEQYKDLIFSPNDLKQIYFSGNIDLNSIEIIKNLLNISDYIEDDNIEKIVLVDLKSSINNFVKMNFLNPSTWKLPIENNRNTLILTELPNYRKIYSYIEKNTDKKLSSLEQVVKIYDVIKLINYNPNNKKNLLHEVIENNKANSYGLNKLFSYILNFLGYKTFICKTKENTQTNYITLIEIIDKKYQVNGIYLFDPSMDTLPKEEYKSNEIRRTNYNFFGINLWMLKRLVFNVELLGILELLTTKDYKYSENRIVSTDNNELIIEIKEILQAFNTSFKGLYKKIKSSKNISIDTIVKINNILYKKKKEEEESRNNMIINNYNERNKELFNPTINEIIEGFVEE